MLNVGCTVQFVSSLMITENKRQILLYPKTEPNVINPKQAGEGGVRPLYFLPWHFNFFYVLPRPLPPTTNGKHRLRTPQRDSYNIKSYLRNSMEKVIIWPKTKKDF